MLRGLWEFLVSLGWVAASLAFSAFSIAAVIGIAFLIRTAFPFLPDAAGAFAFVFSFVIYVVVAGWVAWQIMAWRMRP
ncbi:MAG: hypothetical protein V3V35_07610 [Dehalococcoidia bacterium]